MNCSSINITLDSIDSNHGSQLWGLAQSYNTKYCSWTQMMENLVQLGDFNSSLINPLYQAEIIQIKLDSVFLPVCYAYSILRILMVISVIVYVLQKMDEIIKSNRGIRFPDQKELEIKAYKYCIYLSMVLELTCALRDFILFRGMLLYTNVMEQEQITCHVDFYSNNFTCSNSSEIHASWREFNYSRQSCNCLYHEPVDYFQAEYGSYMIFSISFWIITEGLSLCIVGFSVLTLSRINRQEKSGWQFLKPTISKIFIITLFCIFFYSLLIFYFNMPIYYRFYNKSVVLFYFFWKILGFILVFDRLYSKIWLELKLRFQSLHSHGIDWRVYLEKLRDSVMAPLSMVHPVIKKHYEKYYNENIEPYIDKYEREVNCKLKTKWYDYLNYLLLTNLIGIFGFGFLVFYSFYQKDSLFWIGFTLALIELIVFEVSNIVFQLHCFFIELYKQAEEECKEVEGSLLQSEKSKD